MSTQYPPVEITRRQMLLGTAGLALAAGLPASAAGNLYSPFHVGVQSYSLRHFSLDEALDKTKNELGLRLWEAYPAHMPVSEDPAVIAGYKAKLAARSIRLRAYGVVDFTGDEADARRKLNFARAMGIPVISANPTAEAFPLLDKLLGEYNVFIAIHNHGPGALYSTIDSVQQAVKGHNARIGACVDTGHYLRSGESPLTAVTEFGPRLFDIHLKNVKETPGGGKEFTEVGAVGGLLDTVAILRTLKTQNYRHMIALEYEEHEEDPIPGMKTCLSALRRYTDTVRSVALGGGVSR